MIPILKKCSLINPYYAEIMKKRKVTIDVELQIVENFFIPTESDSVRMTESIKYCKTVVDIGSGYGLLINALAKKNPDKNFLGIDTMYWDKQFKLPIAEKNVRFEFNGIEAMTSMTFNKERRRKKFDCAICCWMPDQSDWREMLAFLAKKAVILILSDRFASGTTEVYHSGMKPFGFYIWKCIS